MTASDFVARVRNSGGIADYFDPRSEISVLVILPDGTQHEYEIVSIVRLSPIALRGEVAPVDFQIIATHPARADGER